MEFFPLREQKGAVMITSSSNQQMKNITALMKKAKERKSQNLFVVEGRKMFEEVPPEWLRALSGGTGSGAAACRKDL